MTNLAYATDTPMNVAIAHHGNHVTLSWSGTSNAHYRVFDCDTPYGVFVLDEAGTFPTATSWTKTENSARKFYQVTAVNGPSPVNLGTAGDFAILAKTGISTIPTSAITGNIGVSPYAATYITGFALTMAAAGTYSTSRRWWEMCMRQIIRPPLLPI